MAGAQVAVSALPAVTVLATADILPFVRSGVTDKITAGNFRTQMFAFAASDPINTGSITAIGNSTITGTLSGITTLTCTTLAAGSFGTLTSDLLFTDATYDIGKTGATRPRDGFFSRNLAIGGRAGFGTAVPAARQVEIQQQGTAAALWVQTAGTDATYTIASFRTGSNAPALEIFGDSSSVFGGAVSGITTLSLAGPITLTTAVSRIIPGATSLSLRNNGNNQDNLLIPDNAASTFRNGLNVGGTITSTLSGFNSSGSGAGYSVAGTQVVVGRITGFTNVWTGAAANAATGYDASTITLAQLAARVRAIQEALTTSTGHGLIGV